MKRFLFLSLLISLAAVGQTYNPNPFNNSGYNNANNVEPDPVPQNVGTGGVELSEIPISLSSGCDSMLLKGAKTYSNTAFLMPKGKVAIDDYGKELIEVVPIKGTSNYNLRVTMSFADVLRDPLAENSLASKIVGCDYEELKFKVNNYLSKVGDGVETLATLPVSNMGFNFKINGKSFAARLGEDSTNSLNYLKEANILEFVLTRPELDDFLELVNGRLGLNVDIDVNFSAKREVGGVYVDIDNKALAREIEAKLGMNYDLAKVQKVAAADLRAALESSINTTTANIVVEGDTRTQTQMFEVSQRIIMSVLQAGGFCSNSMPTGGGLLPGLPGSNPYMRNMGCQDAIGDWRNNKSGSIFGQSQQPRRTPGLPNQPGQQPPFPNPDEPNSGNLIDAKAFLSTLNDQKNFKFNYKIMGGAEIFSYRTSTNMKLNIGDLMLKTTSFSTSEARNMPWSLKAGESFTFYVSRKIVNKLQYTERKNYFNRSDIMGNSQLKDIFETLASVENSDIVNVSDLNEERAVYKWSKKEWVKQPGTFWNVPITLKGDYYWGAYSYELKSQKIVDRHVEISSKSELLKLPLKFSFSQTGSARFDLAKMFIPNKYWSIRFDDFTGAVTLTAKIELGVATVYNLGESGIPNVELTAGVFEEFKGTKSRTFKKHAQYEGKYPTKEEVIEVSTSRFWDDVRVEADMQSLAQTNSPF